jgi:hypothetical protein
MNPEDYKYLDQSHRTHDCRSDGCPGRRFNYYTIEHDEILRLREDNARVLEENRLLREDNQGLRDCLEASKRHSIAGALKAIDHPLILPSKTRGDLAEALEARGWTFTQV